MCEDLIPRTKHRCSHVVDQTEIRKEYQNCGNCGIVKLVSHLGETTKRDPCLDCIENRVWVKVGGVWERA